jgi:hypothetical protein
MALPSLAQIDPLLPFTFFLFAFSQAFLLPFAL